MSNTIFENDPKLVGRDDFLWGVNIHSSYYSAAYKYDNMEENIRLAAEMGAKILRTNSNSPVDELDNFVRLCNAYGIKVMLVVYIPDMGPTAVGNIPAIEERFEQIASRYDGKHGFGKVDFIQLHNETDLMLLSELYGSKGIPAPDGDKLEQWNEEHLACIAEQFKASIRGTKKGCPDTKTVINFCWKHYGMLDYMYEHGVDWDITGHDWYGDMMNACETRDNSTAYGVGERLYNQYKKPIILCETNAFDLQSRAWDDTMVDAYDILVRCMKDIYSKDYVIGAIIYELIDELQFENPNWHRGDEKWNQEGHFGMVFADRNGNVMGPKPIYHRIKNIIGGKHTERITVEDIK